MVRTLRKYLLTVNWAMGVGRAKSSEEVVVFGAETHEVAQALHLC